MVQNDNENLRETTLSPEVRRIRNSIIKKFAHEPLDIMAKFVKDVVENEEDTVKRLGAMAARVEILRMRISQISDSGADINFEDTTMEETEEHKFEEDTSEIVITSPNLTDWVRLRIVENSEINGVRFPKGVVIDVSQEDGDRLLESGKASYVDEDEIADIKSDLNLKENIDQKLSKSTDDMLEQAEEDNQEDEDSAEILEKVLAEETVNPPDNKGSIVEQDQNNEATGNADDITDIEVTVSLEGSDDQSDNKKSDDMKDSISGDKETDPKELKKTKPKTENNKSLEKTAKTVKTDQKSEAIEDLENPAKESDNSPDAMLAGFDLESDDSKTK